VKFFQKKLNIELSPATIVHIDKHSRSGVFTDDRFFPLAANTLHTNIVFQLKESNKVLPLNVRDMQLPLYNMQEVDIITANQFVIGYVDVESEEYYYFTNDFCKAAGIGFIDIASWLTGILVAGCMLTIIKDEYAGLFAFILLFALWISTVTLKTILNKKIESNMDEILKTFSIL
jgi:hypothetical protein